MSHNSFIRIHPAGGNGSSTDIKHLHIKNKYYTHFLLLLLLLLLLFFRALSTPSSPWRIYAHATIQFGNRPLCATSAQASPTNCDNYERYFSPRSFPIYIIRLYIMYTYTLNAIQTPLGLTFRISYAFTTAVMNYLTESFNMLCDL